MKKTILAIALFLAVSLSISRAGDAKSGPLIVHEWGTFTSLQDEQGNAIGGINTDDEPVPSFVHRISYRLLTPQSRNAEVINASMLAKGLMSQAYEEVTMRLETPVIYFYPPADWKPEPVDVHVSFPGGWLSEFYPDAESVTPGFNPKSPIPFGHLRKDTTGELTWSSLKIGLNVTGPETTEKVWLAPRQVKSANVTAMTAESEKFLFYRGVGNVDSPLRIARNTGNDLELRDNECMQSANMPAQRINAAWLVDVRGGGACAFKSLGPVEAGKGIRATMPGSFSGKEYSTDNMAQLRGEMRAALIKQGLFADEADALLNTWEVSYFKNPGLRFFYLCPRVQVDATLPLKLSVPARISRVMIGRIEIVTPGQRNLLADIAAGPSPGPLAQDGEKIAKLNEDYFELGRFRNALILDEQKRRPTAALAAFITRNSLGAYVVAP